MPTLIVCEDADTLASRAADLIIEVAREAIASRGLFTLALSGGSTPEKTYKLLAEPDRASAIDWSKTYIFLSDERFVPAHDLRSNFGMVEKALFARAAIPQSNIFPVWTECANAAQSAADYEEKLVGFFSKSGDIGPPRFDLILLGLGADGHTASLFPGSPALGVVDACATWSLPGSSPPPVERITLTYRVLNAARHLVFLVCGAKKAAALRDVLQGHAASASRPAAGVRPTDGVVTWLVDKDAVKLLDPGVNDRFTVKTSEKLTEKASRLFSTTDREHHSPVSFSGGSAPEHEE